MSSTIWEFGYEDADSPLVTVSVCDYGTVHLHMELTEADDDDSSSPLSVTMPQRQAEEVALELLRRAYSFDDAQLDQLRVRIRLLEIS